MSITTSVFALVTVIAYLLLFDKQNVHGWTTMSHSASVFCFFVLLGAAHLSKEESEEIHGTPGCKFIGIFTHISVVRRTADFSFSTNLLGY